MAHQHFNAMLDLHRHSGREQEFWPIMSWYLSHGYVVNTPEFFALYQPVLRSQSDNVHPDYTRVCRPENPDAWYIHALAGNLAAFGQSLPHPLPFVGFGRAKGADWKPTKWLAFQRLHQLIYHHA